MLSHKSPISGVATHMDVYVATAGYDNDVILWDHKTGLPVARGRHDHLANQCRFSADGRFLVSCSSDYSARVWHVPSMRLLAVLGDHADDVESVAVHPGGAFVATACRDGLVRIFDTSGRLCHRLMGHTADVISVEWIEDGNRLVSSSDDGTVKCWDASFGLLSFDFDLGDIETDTVVVTELGTIFAGNDLGEIVTIGGKHPAVKAHDAGIKRLIYNDSSRRLMSLSYDRQARIWDVASDGALTLTGSATLPPEIWPRSAAFAGENTVVFATFGSKYATFDLATKAWSFVGVDPTCGVNAALETASGLYTVGDAGYVRLNGVVIQRLPSLCNFLGFLGDRILTGGQTGEIFDAISGEVIFQHRSPLNCIASFSDGGIDKAIIGTYTGEGVILALAGREAVVEATVEIHRNAIKSLAVKGGVIFSVSANRAAAWHDARGLHQIAYQDSAHDKIANGCAALANGAFVSVSRDLKLRVWSGAHCESFRAPHTHSIKCVATSDCGEYIATGSYGGELGIFHLPSRTWRRHTRLSNSGLSALSLSADSKCFLASSYDGNVYRIPIMEAGACVSSSSRLP